jgi:hypothetical protein
MGVDDTIHVHIAFSAGLLNWLHMCECSKLRNQIAKRVRSNRADNLRISGHLPIHKWADYSEFSDTSRIFGLLM